MDNILKTKQAHLIGQQITGKYHLSTKNGEQRCGIARSRVRMTPRRGEIGEITCVKCRRIAEREEARNA